MSTTKPVATPQDKENEKRRKSLQLLCNRISSAVCFKTAKTWRDVLAMQGMSDADMMTSPKAGILSQPIIPSDLKKHFDELKAELEKQIAGVKEEEKKDALAQAVAKVVEEVKPALVEINTSDNDYGFSKSPYETAFLYWFQKKAVVELFDGITKHNKRGQLLLSSTGTGKTFMAGALLRRLKDVNFADEKTYGAIQYLYVTRSTIVEQTKRVFEKFFNLGIKDAVEVLNIEQLRSRAGSAWVNEKMEIVNGEEKWTWEWRKMLNPVVVLWDECQALKNDTSSQHKIAAAFNDIKSPTYQVFISATPFTRVSEAKCFACSTRKNIKETLGLLMDSTLSNQTWVSYASAIASPSAPSDYNEAAVERLTKDLEKYIIRVRGVRPQYEANNKIVMIHFANAEEKKYYDDTEKRYLEKKAKLAEKLGIDFDQGGGIWGLVLMNERCMAAEYCRRYHIAKKMYESVMKGYAAVAAVKYKNTLIAVVKILVDEMKVPRDKISLVWGGGQTQLTQKQKVKAQLKAKAEALQAAGLDVEDMMKDFELEDVEDRVVEELPEHLRLGAQSPDERQREIDRFQSGRSVYCLYTFKAGGVGLSLHHTDEFTTKWNEAAPGYVEWKKKIDEWNKHRKPENQVKPGKCRRKESGYAFEEDIPFIPVRPRINFVAPTYSAMEMVQGLGRCPRLTSLSTTQQELLYYAETVEQDVALIVGQKLRCLAKVVRMRESWADVVVGGVKFRDEHIKNTEGMVDDPDDLGSEGGEEEE